MRYATRQLRESIQQGKVQSSEFTEQQLNDIRAGLPEIEGFSWNHNPQGGNNMQLVPRSVHDAAKHTGQHALSRGK